MSTTKQIPEGYIENARGGLDPIASVKDIDILRDELVQSLITRGLKAAAIVAEYKAAALSEIENFVDLSAAEYGVKRGGKKGNVSLKSYSGKHKVVLSRDETCEFDERLAIGQQLIRECIDDLLEGSNTDLKTLIDKAFETNKQGQVSVLRIMGLRQVQISHPKWKKAMDILADSVHASARKTYIRLYQRSGEEDSYTQIPLDGSPKSC
jgi:hypothetical protein